MKICNNHLLTACWIMCAVFALCAVFAPRAVHADNANRTAPTDSAEPDRWHIGAFTEPLTFALGGYSAGVELRPKPLPRMAIALHAYSAALPDAFLPERNDGFHVDIQNAIELDGNVFFARDGAGWFVGGAIATFDTRYTHDMEPGMATDIRSWELHAQGGYRWIPSRWLGLFIQPWGYLGAVVVSSSSDKDKIDVGDSTFDDIPVRFNVAVHVGYEL